MQHATCRGAMTSCLLAHAKRTSTTAVSSTTPALRCYSPPTTSRAAPPPFSRVHADGTPLSPGKVGCVCGSNSRAEKALVECLQCGLWSHIQCARLTQRTAKRSQFLCYQCRLGTSKSKSSKRLVVRIPVQQSTSVSTVSSSSLDFSRIQTQDSLHYTPSTPPPPCA